MGTCGDQFNFDGLQINLNVEGDLVILDVACCSACSCQQLFKIQNKTIIMKHKAYSVEL